jgi:hypothetical protein
MNKPAKPHAALANPNGPQGKPKKSTRKVAISLPRHYLARENSTESESSGNDSPVHHAMFARVQMDPMPKFSVQSIFGPKSRPALDKFKTRWDKDCFGYHNPRPWNFDEAAVYRVNAIQSLVNHWDDRSIVASPKDSLTIRTQEISLSDEDRRDERLAPPRAELLHHAESLLSSTKSVVLYEREPVIVEEDRAEQIPEIMSTEDNHGLELEIDHPPSDAGNVQPEAVCNVPPETRSRTRLASYRYPSPYCPVDDEDGGLLYDSYDVPMRPGEDLGNSSIQATGTSRDKLWHRNCSSSAKTNLVSLFRVISLSHCHFRGVCIRPGGQIPDGCKHSQFN